MKTFEEYLSQKEEELKMTLGPKEREKLKKQYDQMIASSSHQVEETSLADYADQFESVVINLGAVTTQKNARKYFQGLLNEGNTGKIENYLNRLALEGLTGKTLTDYNSMGTVFAGAQTGLQDIDSFASLNPSLYKTAI